MTDVIVLGAAGGIARIATNLFLSQTDARLTLFLRNATRLKHPASDRVRVVEGDVLDTTALADAMLGHDVVYANLAGDLEQMAHSVVEAMHTAAVTRLIWISSMGIYDEVPGERKGAILDPYRKSARVVEASDLNYTILRPGWFTDSATVSYETTRKGEAFRGHDVSRSSVAFFVVQLAVTPGIAIRQSLGVNTPVR